MKRFGLIVMFCGLILPLLTMAKMGVGIVGIGKINVDQPLKPGLIYTLPSLVVANTGDEASDYSVTVQFREKQEQLKASKDWFSFEPKNFHLEPDQTQIVTIRMTLPVKGVKPGDYFAFLQAYPIQKTDVVGTSIGIAAAAKLYFTVVPVNFFAGIYYRLISLVALYNPWSYVVLYTILAAILVMILRRFISFNIGINLKKK